MIPGFVSSLQMKVTTPSFSVYIPPQQRLTGAGGSTINLPQALYYLLSTQIS